MKKLLIILITHLFILTISGQPVKQNLIYIDNQGVVRYTKTKQEAAFFGVNYTVPFAYGYRSHLALGVDIEKAFDADVYHFERLGFNAFRVHVWDVEISDTAGNLLQNEHLRLFDYLIAQLKKRHIKILVTPIAFWGNGWPEKDLPTPGFSSYYGKEKAVVAEPAIKAQENYLQQFFRHVNPYTKLSYRDDPDIIATEINNEPKHSGAKEKTTAYINRLAAAIRSTGWTKPIFYNISESPVYADAIVKAKVDGYSFQWYPTGLVANRKLKGNYLPHVDVYRIPFGDTIAAFKNKPLMVYEFDAGDVGSSVMYPAMARSYRTAGFWWATQFAYDPMATAYANTEYGTHYLNLAYTPSKAISMLIASSVFQQIPRGKTFGSYPENTTFGDFSIDYENDRSEMNSTETFYYSNSTAAIPRNITTLKKIAGVGSSNVVQYAGTGAYFLDQIDSGVWRLEVMPDAIEIRDPYGKASPGREVVRIEWHSRDMRIHLKDLGDDFTISAVNDGNSIKQQAVDASFRITPGVYLLRNGRHLAVQTPLVSSAFFAPRPHSGVPYISHAPATSVTAERPFTLAATIVGIDTADQVSVELRNTAGQWRTVAMTAAQPYRYTAEVPADLMAPGLLNYRMIIKKKAEYFTFPGAHKGDPYAWDYYHHDSWQTAIMPAAAPVDLFIPERDRLAVTVYNPNWRHNTFTYVMNDAGHLVLKAHYNDSAARGMGVQYFFKDQLKGRGEDVQHMPHLKIKAQSATSSVVRITLITSDAVAYSALLNLASHAREYSIPIASFKPDAFYLLPRPYPHFHPLKFQSAASKPLVLQHAEKLEISFATPGTVNQTFEVEYVKLAGGT